MCMIHLPIHYSLGRTADDLGYMYFDPSPGMPAASFNVLWLLLALKWPLRRGGLQQLLVARSVLVLGRHDAKGVGLKCLVL